MLYKSHSESSLGMPADRRMPVIADGGRSVIGLANKPVSQKNRDASTGRPYIDSFDSKSQQRRRSLSTTHKQSCILVPQRRRSLGDVASIMTKPFKAEQESPPCFKQPQRRRSLGDVASIIEKTSEAEQKLPPSFNQELKLFVTENLPSPDSYAKFKQRQAIAKELNCPLDTAKDAQGLFDCYAQKGILEYKSFREIVLKILKSAGQELSEEDMEGSWREVDEKKIEVSWREVDRNYSGKVDFDEFAIWYSSWGFHQELLLSPTKIRTRDLARKHNLSIAEVDSVHSMFQFVDEDESGEIEFPEFEKLLYKLLKVPKEAELPATRLQHFWKQIDIDGSGSVDFAEFLQWYLKYFDMKGTGHNITPMERFYQSMRPHVWRC